MDLTGKSLLVAIAGFVIGAAVVLGLALVIPPPTTDAPLQAAAEPPPTQTPPTPPDAASSPDTVGGTGTASERGAMDALVATLQEPADVEREEQRPPAPTPATAQPHEPVVEKSTAAKIEKPVAEKPEEPTAPKAEPAVVAKAGKAETPAWQRYAAAADLRSDRPQLAIILDDMGLSRERMERAIALPGPLTMAILPYGYDLPELAAQARNAGHELLVHMPSEPEAHDLNPGPNALLIGLDDAELRRRIIWNLTRFNGYVGVNNHMGSRFTRELKPMTALMAEVQRRGLLFVDSVTTNASVGTELAGRLGVPTAGRDVFLDNDRVAGKIRKRLNEAVMVAHQRGQSIAIGHPYPETLEVLKDWLPGASAAGVTLVPVSAIVRRRLRG